MLASRNVAAHPVWADASRALKARAQNAGERVGSISGYHFIRYAHDARDAFGQSQERLVLLLRGHQTPKVDDAPTHDDIALTETRPVLMTESIE